MLVQDGPRSGTGCNNLDFSHIGYAIVTAFVITWAVSIVVWKKGRIEERWGSMVEDG